MKKDDLLDLTEYEIYQRMDCGDNIALFFRKKSKDFCWISPARQKPPQELGIYPSSGTKERSGRLT